MKLVEMMPDINPVVNYEIDPRLLEVWFAR